MKFCKALLFLSFLISISCKEHKVALNVDDEKIQTLVTGSQKPMPKVWIDKDTEHKIKRLVNREGNNKSFYFHNNPFVKSKDGKSDLMLFYGRDKNVNQFFSINLKNDSIDQITKSNSKKKGEIVGKKSRKIFYMVADSIFSTHIDTHETEFIYKFSDSIIGSVTSLNADETLLGGALITKEENDIFKKNPSKSNYFEKIYEAKLNRSLFTINLKTKKLEPIYSEDAWLNHIQFSPTDPDILMYCHEGPWHKVDRIWNINIHTKETELMHKRKVHREIAGHEFFSPDGKNIWFDLQIPRGETFYLAKRGVYSNDTLKYALERNEWSIHFNISPDQKLFAGDGGDKSQVARAEDGMWLYLFTPNKDHLASEKLVNMMFHDYSLEPNVHFSPDGKWIIFRANFEGSTQIYAVEIKKTSDNEL